MVKILTEFLFAGTRQIFGLEKSIKSLHLLPVLLVIYFSPLYIFRAIGRTVFTSEPTRPCSMPTDVWSQICTCIFTCVYAGGAAFSTMFDHLSIWHATQSSILFTSQIYSYIETYICWKIMLLRIKIPPNIYSHIFSRTNGHIFYGIITKLFFSLFCLGWATKYTQNTSS